MALPCVLNSGAEFAVITDTVCEHYSC